MFKYAPHYEFSELADEEETFLYFSPDQTIEINGLTLGAFSHKVLSVRCKLQTSWIRSVLEKSDSNPVQQPAVLAVLSGPADQPTTGYMTVQAQVDLEDETVQLFGFFPSSSYGTLSWDGGTYDMAHLKKLLG